MLKRARQVTFIFLPTAGKSSGCLCESFLPEQLSVVLKRKSFNIPPMLKSLIFLSILTAFAAIPKKASVFLADAKPEPFADTLTYPGRVRSRVNAATTSEIEGQVVRIEKPLGSKISKGEVI